MLRRNLSLAALGALVPLPALAWTPDQVWQSVKLGLGSLGMSVSAENVVRRTGALTLTGVRVEGDTPIGHVVETIDAVTLHDLKDGRVTVEGMTDETLSLIYSPPHGQQVTATLVQKMTGAKGVVSGPMAAPVLTFEIPHIDEVMDISPFGLIRDAVHVEMAVTNRKFQETVQVGHGKPMFDFTDAIEKMETKSTWEIARGGQSTQMSEHLGLSSEIRVSLPKGPIPRQVIAAAKAGLTASIRFSEASVSTTGAETGAVPTHSIISTGPSEMMADFGQDGLTLQYGLSDLSVALAIYGEKPIPLGLAVADMKARVKVPLFDGQGAQPFQLALALAGARLPPEVWKRIDRTGAIPNPSLGLTLQAGGTAMLAPPPRKPGPAAGQRRLSFRVPQPDA